MMVPLASLLAEGTGHWHVVFMVAVAMNALAAVLAMVALRRCGKGCRHGPDRCANPRSRTRRRVRPE